MKYIHSDGIRLVVRDIGPEIWEAKISDEREYPLPIITHQIMDDDTAREICKNIVENVGIYHCKKLI